VKKNLLYFSCIVFLLCIFFTIHSCRKSNNSHLWDIDVLAPLVQSSFSINDILTDSLLSKNPDNSFDVVYNNSLSSFKVISVPDTTIDTTFFSPFQVVLDSCDVIIPSNNDETNFQIQPVQLTSIKIHSGKMRIHIENTSRKILDIRYQIPSATLGTYSFDVTVTVPAKSAGNPGMITTDFDLSGYTLDLRGKNKTKANTFVSSIGVKVNCNDIQKDTIFPFSDNIKISNSFISIEPSYAKGYFGKITEPFYDTTDVALFNHITSGSLSLEDIKVGFNIENSVGVDAKFTLKQLQSINTKSTNQVSLSGSIIGNSQNINRAADNNGIVVPATYTTSFTTSNSNIKSFFENLPDKMTYNMSFEINPLGNISGSNDFYYKDKSIKTNINVTFPLSLVANNLTMIDTVDFSLDTKSIQEINYGTLYLYANNGFPFYAQVQLLLMDNNFSVMDSLVTMPNTILPPALDQNYICIGKQKSKIALSLDVRRLNSIKSCKKISMKIKFNTAGTPNYVKIYDNYKLDVKLVGDFNYAIKKM